MAAEGKVLVSGFLDSKERTDQFVFDVLHSQGAWSKIVAFSHQTSFAKKRLISRTARYTGLLDVLEFDEGDRYDSALMQEKLQGCDAWLCFDCAADKIKEQVETAKAAGIKTLVLTSSLSAADAKAADLEQTFKAAGVKFTFIRTGTIKEGKEGGIVTVKDFSEDLPTEEVLREDIVRAAAEVFRIDDAANKAFSFGKGDAASAEYLKSLREEGVDRVTELSNLINGTYTKYVQNKENEAAEAEAKAKGEEFTTEEKEAKTKEFKADKQAEIAAAMLRIEERQKQDMEKRITKAADQLIADMWTKLKFKGQPDMTEEEHKAENWDKAFAKATKMVKADMVQKGGGAALDDDEMDTHWNPDKPSDDQGRPLPDPDADGGGDAKAKSDDKPSKDKKK